MRNFLLQVLISNSHLLEKGLSRLRNYFQELIYYLIRVAHLKYRWTGKDSVFATGRSEQNCCLSIFNKEQYLLNPLRHHNCFVRGLLHDCKMNFHRSTSTLHVFKTRSNCCQTFFLQQCYLCANIMVWLVHSLKCNL